MEKVDAIYNRIRITKIRYFKCPQIVKFPATFVQKVFIVNTMMISQ